MRKINYTIVLLAILLVGCRKGSEDKTETMQVDPEKLVQGPIVHDELTELQKSRITAVQQIFSEVDPTPLGKWMDDFQRDRNPDREIAIWEGMAGPFATFTSKPGITLEMKKEAFSLLLSRSGSSTEETLKKIRLSVLSAEQAKELLDGFKHDPKPITVTPTKP